MLYVCLLCSSATSLFRARYIACRRRRHRLKRWDSHTKRCLRICITLMPLVLGSAAVTLSTLCNSFRFCRNVLLVHFIRFTAPPFSGYGCVEVILVVFVSPTSARQAGIPQSVLLLTTLPCISNRIVQCKGTRGNESLSLSFFFNSFIFSALREHLDRPFRNARSPTISPVVSFFDFCTQQS